AERADLVGVEGLDGRLRPDGHEDRRRDVAVGRVEDAGARPPVSRGYLEAHGQRIGIRGPWARARRRSVVTSGILSASARATKQASAGLMWEWSSQTRSRRCTCG